jgi:hypothetical protein
MLLRLQGATVLLVQYITPLMRKHESAIDLALESGYKKARYAVCWRSLPARRPFLHAQSLPLRRAR